MRQVNSFEAVDGRLFKTEKECLDYEKSIVENVETDTVEDMIIQGVVRTEVTTYTRYKGVRGKYVETNGYLNIGGIWKVRMDEMLMYSYADHVKPEYLTKDFHSSQEEFITSALHMLTCVFCVEKANKRLCEIRSEIFGCHAHIESDGNVIKVSGMPGDMIIEYIYKGKID